jgi:hypothetical protein
MTKSIDKRINSFIFKIQRNPITPSATHFERFDETVNYRDLIKWDLYTPKEKFGQHFKQAGGLKHVIRTLYVVEDELAENNENGHKTLIFDFAIGDIVYVGCLLQLDRSVCDTCGLVFKGESEHLYIADSLDALLKHSIPFKYVERLLSA